MSNTDKLLRAFIEASGYEIKEVITIKDGQSVSEKDVIYSNVTTTTTNYKVIKKMDDQRRSNLIASAYLEYQAGSSTLEELHKTVEGLL